MTERNDAFEVLKQDVYLGDGVYASFDGYQVWLAVNDHRNQVVALEPAVMAALADYYARLTRSLAALDGSSHD